MLRHCLISILALLLLAGISQAAIISYNGYLDFNSTGNANLNLNQFDTSLGTLTGVKIYVSHSGGAVFNLDNDDVIPITAYAQMDRAWTLTATGLNASDSHTTTTGNVSLAADDGDGGNTSNVEFTSPDGYSWPPVSFNDPAVAYTIGAGDWAAYQGLGTFALNANVTNFVNAINYVGTPPNQVATYMANLNPGLRLNTTVEYTYETDYVPEPGTMCLLGLGLAGIGAWRRRKKS